MKDRSTFSLLFYIRKERQDNSGKVPIYLRVTVNGEKATFSINQKVELNSWDVQRGIINPRSKSASGINNYIQIIKNRAYDAYKQIVEEDQVVTPNKVINIILGNKKREHTLIHLIERHNDEMKGSIGYSSTYGNYKNYKTTLKYVRSFINDILGQRDIILIELDHSFITEFSLYIQKEKQCGNNGTMKHLQRLKKVLNIALDNEWIIRNPFAKIKIKFNPYDRIILNKEELEAIEKVGLNSHKLSLVRDAFIFSCYTGLAYVDLKNITIDNIVLGVDGTPWIITRRQKSDIKARIPLLPKAIKLIEKYKSHPKLKAGHVIPMISNQKTNDYLKEIAKIAGIEKPISFHVARHIFATVITLANGVPIETVSKVLGHTDIRTTQVYARVIDEKIASDFQILKSKV